MRQGLIGFLDASLTPEVQRILLIDGPAVLGWSRWRELESRYGLGGIQANALRRATWRRASRLLLAHVLLAAAEEAAMFIANAPDQQAARNESVRALSALLDGLRSR
ncbi:hypothetical protein [Mycobacterium asiaticum]|uniref:hypothetical protein n=1 Tax=Mycobacterium asiaticum TaxID=1790 RepID=UPI0031451AB3